MKLNLKYVDILNAHGVLAQYSNKDLDVETSMPLAFTLLALEEKVNEFEAGKQEIIKSHSKKDEAGNIVLKNEKTGEPEIEDMTAASKALNDLTFSEVELELEDGDVFTLSHLKSIKKETMGVKPIDVIKLKAFFEAQKS